MLFQHLSPSLIFSDVVCVWSDTVQRWSALTFVHPLAGNTVDKTFLYLWWLREQQFDEPFSSFNSWALIQHYFVKAAWTAGLRIQMKWPSYPTTRESEAVLFSLIYIALIPAASHEHKRDLTHLFRLPNYFSSNRSSNSGSKPMKRHRMVQIDNSVLCC